MRNDDHNHPPDRTALRQYALRALTRREFGRAELMQRMLRRGADPDLAATVADELQAQGFLSDERYAESFARSRRGQYSQRMIARQLQSHGIAAETSAAALASVAEESSPDSEDDEALALWRRRFGVKPKDEKEKNRQIRFLLSRGYSLSVILGIFRHIKDNCDNDS